MQNDDDVDDDDDVNDVSAHTDICTLAVYMFVFHEIVVVWTLKSSIDFQLTSHRLPCQQLYPSHSIPDMRRLRVGQNHLLV